MITGKVQDLSHSLFTISRKEVAFLEGQFIFSQSELFKWLWLARQNPTFQKDPCILDT